MSIANLPRSLGSASSAHEPRSDLPSAGFPLQAVEQSILSRFAQQVYHYPTHPAITMGTEHLTYEALDAAANRVAGAIIQQLGSQSEPVALLFHQGMACLIALLGILKAGKFYLPLEPWHPATRLTETLTDAQAPLVITPAHYVELAQDAPACSVPAWRQWLQERLPDYMVPTTVVPCTTLPRTASGKVDRQALPTAVQMQQPATVTTPRTALEAQVQQIWSEVLGLEAVGMHDHFLDLGGNSLLVMQVLTRVQAIWNLEIAMQTLLEAPTVAQMALVIVAHLLRTVEKEARYRLLAEVEAVALSDDDRGQGV